MPQYEFKCKKCGVEYVELSPYDESGKYPKVKCPECGSKRKEKLISQCTMTFVNPEGTKWWAASHDRRYFHKLEKDRKLRQEAETKSHVGPTPYPDIDDISSGLSFGEVQ